MRLGIEGNKRQGGKGEGGRRRGETEGTGRMCRGRGTGGGVRPVKRMVSLRWTS